MSQTTIIEVCRLPWGDAAKIVGEIAKQEGHKIVTSLRWRGPFGPSYRDVRLANGWEIRVLER